MLASLKVGQSRQTNNEVKLNFEVPLQQNIAKGKILQSNSKINLLKIEESFYRDKITNEIKQISNSIQTSAKIFNNYLQEYKLYQIRMHKLMQIS